MDLSSTPPPPHGGTSTPPAINPSAHDTATLSQHQQHQHPQYQQQQHQHQQSQIGPGTGYSSPNRQPKKSSATCTTCRARKVRCNGARPLCSNCQRLGFPCSYDDDVADPAAAAVAWSIALPRRRVKQACLSCHSRKARCSGHMPACDRCRAQGIECVYRPTKRARVSTKSTGGGRDSPQSHDDDSHRDDGQGDSDSGFPDVMGDGLGDGHLGVFGHDAAAQDESFDELIARTFDKFFRHVHHIPMFSFLHRASLMEQYHAGKVDRCLLLALVGITTCLTDMGPGMRIYGNRCIDEAESMILSDYARPSTIKVQALVFMIKHRILSNRFPSAFVLLSVASRFAVALKLNFDPPNICFLAQESRRRLVWALYCIDAGISGGNRDYSLWRAERIFIGLPCNERNFEFDLPQDTEKLIPDPDQPPPAQGEDVGSLALHIRIQHIRHKISEFTKDSLLAGPAVNPSRLQTQVLSLHRELEDFAAQLPVSFQFSENSLRLRAYSPRICVFVMIHIWWRQCHCDLYRLGLVGLREALSTQVLDTFDRSFIEHCQRQCVDHAMAMASIFSSMQKLKAKPVADLDLGICAYQCARMLRYAYHANSGNLNIGQDTVMEQFKICLQAVKECCTGIAAAGIKSDIEKIISSGLGPRTMPVQGAAPGPDPSRQREPSRMDSAGGGGGGGSHSHGGGSASSRNTHHTSRNDMTAGDNSNNYLTSPPTSASTLPQTASPSDAFSTTAPTAHMAPTAAPVPTPASTATPTHPMPQAMMTDAWSTSPGGSVGGGGGGDSDMALDDFDRPGGGGGGGAGAGGGGGPSSIPSELNNAFEGATDEIGLDYSMGIDVSAWGPEGENWPGDQFVSNGPNLGV